MISISAWSNLKWEWQVWELCRDDYMQYILKQLTKPGGSVNSHLAQRRQRVIWEEVSAVLTLGPKIGAGPGSRRAGGFNRSLWFICERHSSRWWAASECSAVGRGINLLIPVSLIVSDVCERGQSHFVILSCAAELVVLHHPPFWMQLSAGPSKWKLWIAAASRVWVAGEAASVLRSLHKAACTRAECVQWRPHLTWLPSLGEGRLYVLRWSRSMMFL